MGGCRPPSVHISASLHLLIECGFVILSRIRKPRLGRSLSRECVNAVGRLPILALLPCPLARSQFNSYSQLLEPWLPSAPFAISRIHFDLCVDLNGRLERLLGPRRLSISGSFSRTSHPSFSLSGCVLSLVCINLALVRLDDGISPPPPLEGVQESLSPSCQSCPPSPRSGFLRGSSGDAQSILAWTRILGLAAAGCRSLSRPLSNAVGLNSGR